jgi:HSP20 family protein
MLTLRQSPFDLFERLEQQLQTAERVPAAEVRDTTTSFLITLELPGVDRDSIDVKATDRSLVISAERRAPQAKAKAEAEAEAEPAGPLLSEFRYGSWSRSFRFPAGIDREGLSAHYRDGLLTVTAPKAQTMTSVSVKVEG